ncbi:MAG: methionyl-tRNA formyltransferase [Candidatus Omnitrophota bacterium]
MKIIFFGSDKFGVPSLKALSLAGYHISCVVTQPDRRKGRGLHFEGTPIKEAAFELGVKIFQPRDVNSKESLEYLKKIGADLFIIIAYGQIFSQETLDLPRIMPINLHASLLPAYRGAAPINWAIIQGEGKTGVTVVKVIRKMDSGPVILQEEAPIIKEDSVITLEDKLAQVGAKILMEAMVKISNKSYKLIQQDEKKASLAPKLKKSDGAINWDSPPEDIYNLIRGCAGWPGAFAYYNGKLLKIYKAKISSQVRKFASSNPGEILEASKEGIVVLTGKGNIIIEELQMEGKRIMSAAQFLSGHKISAGERFGT